MVLWVIVLASALAGGILLLHGFAMSKAVSEQMLDTYQKMLNTVAEGKHSAKGDPTDDPGS